MTVISVNERGKGERLGRKYLRLQCCLRKFWQGGAWVAHLVERPPLDFGAGRDFTVCDFESRIGLCADSTEPAWDSLSPSLSLLLPHLCSPSK